MNMSVFNTDLKEIKRKSMASFHEDGIIDLVIGTYGLVWGFMFLTDDQSFAAIWIIFLAPFYWGLKRYYTLPRIGLVKFSSEGRNVTKGIVIALLAVVLAAGIVVLLLSGVGSFLRSYGFFIMGVLLALIGVGYAYVSSIKRFYLYAFFALMNFISAQYSGLPLGLHVIVPSAVITCSGLYLLYVFTRRYPLVRVEGQVA